MAHRRSFAKGDRYIATTSFEVPGVAVVVQPGQLLTALSDGINPLWTSPTWPEGFTYSLLSKQERTLQPEGFPDLSNRQEVERWLAT